MSDHLANLEAECAVLSALMNDAASWSCIGTLAADDFTQHQHRLIFRAASELHRASKACDFLTVTEHMRASGTLDEAGGLAAVGALANDGYAGRGFEAHAKILADYSRRRRLRDLCLQTADAAKTEYADAILARISVGLEQIGRNASRKARSFAEVMDATDAALRAAQEKRRRGGTLGAPTGLPCVDQRTGGLCAPRLWVLAARPSLGKSALLNQIGLHAAAHGHPGLICSLEMSDEELGTRAMALRSKVNVSRLAFGFEDEYRRANKSCAELGALPLWVDTDTYTLSGICAQIAHYKRAHGIKWAAVDHIGLVEADGFNNRNDQLGAVTRTLKKLCKRLDLPIIALSQLNRSVEKERRRPSLADLRDSGNIEQDADVCLFLHTDATDDATQIPMQFGLLKNRGGKRSWLAEKITFDGPTQTFREIASVGTAALHHPRRPDTELEEVEL